MNKLLLYSALTILMIITNQRSVFSQNTFLMCTTDTTSDANGILYDSGGPNNTYQNSEDCSLLVSPSSASIIALTFQYLSIETSFDFLYIYDGPTTSSPMVFSASGTIVPTTVYCTSGQMLIVFHSDFSIVDSGFACTWTAINCPCGLISGRAYNDINGNCMYDTGEEVKQIPLLLDDGAQFILWTTTDSVGNYSFNVPVGNTYNVQVNAGNGYNGRFSPSCPLSGAVSINTVPSTGNDFGLTCLPGYDLTGSMTGWRFRPGFVSTICVNVYNHRCYTPSGQIELVFDSMLTPLPDTNGIGYTINGNTVTFPIHTPDLDWQFCIPVQTSLNAQIGDSLCIAMNLQPISGDSFPADNIVTSCFAVSNSFDPNDKYVSPKGIGAEGYVLPNTTLTYTIRFQNTGNADAVNIHVLDGLSSNLDPSTVEVIAASHDMHWSMQPGNILRFDFDNINLADSNSNEPASHGYVTYRVKMINNIAQLAAINNMASIYFDFNSPIYTNTTLNTVDMFLQANSMINNSSSVNIYPNPANGKCQLLFKDNHLRKITVTDVRGKAVFNNQINAASYFLNTSSFAEGVYIIRITDENELREVCKLIVSH